MKVVATSTPPISPVDLVRAAVSQNITCSLDELQAAIGNLVVIEAAQAPAGLAVGEADRSVFDPASRTTMLLADRIPEGEEAQVLAAELVRHHGLDAAVAVMGDAAKVAEPNQRTWLTWTRSGGEETRSRLASKRRDKMHATSQSDTVSVPAEAQQYVDYFGADYQATAVSDEIQLVQASLADRAFERYDFGDGVDVTDSSGWEYMVPGSERSRKVYVETEAEDDGPAPRWALSFTVRFDPATGSLVEAYALDDKGQVWGELPQEKKARPLEPKASTELVSKVLNQLDANPRKPLVRILGDGYIVAKDAKTNRAIAVVDGDFGRGEFKAVHAEIANTGLASDAIVVVATTATYSGRGIHFMKLEDLGVIQVAEKGGDAPTLVDEPMVAPRNAFVTVDTVHRAEVSWCFSDAKLHDGDYRAKVDVAVTSAVKLAEAKYSVQQDGQYRCQWEGVQFLGTDREAVTSAANDVSKVVARFKGVEPLPFNVEAKKSRDESPSPGM